MSTETDQVRARVAELERQLAEQAARANAAVAAAQERAYWLDRWQIDLNRLMATRRWTAFRAAVRAIRVPVRRLRLLKRSLLG